MYILFVTVPGIPEDITVTYLSETNSVTLSWFLKCKNGVIQEYGIEYFNMDDSSGSKNLSTKGSEIQISGLPVGKTFKFQVIPSVGQVKAINPRNRNTIVIQLRKLFSGPSPKPAKTPRRVAIRTK